MFKLKNSSGRNIPFVSIKKQKKYQKMKIIPEKKYTASLNSDG